MILPEEIVRDEYGFFYHSLVLKAEDETPFTELPGADAMEFFFISFDENASDELKEIYEKAGNPFGKQYDWSDAVKKWEPSMLASEGWFLLAIYDTEDGPNACFTRPKNNMEKNQ